MGATPAPQRGELVAEHDRGELAGVQRLGVGAIDAAQSGLDVERRLDTLDCEDERAIGEPDRVAAG